MITSPLARQGLKYESAALKKPKKSAGQNPDQIKASNDANLDQRRGGSASTKNAGP